jgi:hypothetical protein
VRFHFVCECIKNNKFIIVHVLTHNMLADILTKPLSQILLEIHRSYLRS